MSEIDVLFKNRKLKAGGLLAFGFSEEKGGYAYSAGLVDGEFEMVVTVTKAGRVSAEVIDAASREPYVLHRVAGTQGAFVGRVREEYAGVLAAIAKACFEPDVFKSECAGRVIRYVGETYRGELEFLWQRFSDNAIFRRQDNSKWYAALLVLEKKKLGLPEEGTVDIIDLRATPEDVAALVDGKRYFPGFHMNKKHWLTICLDGSVPEEEIFRRIDASYALAAK